MHPAAAHHRGDDLHLAQLLRLACHGIAVEHDEVRQIAGQELAAPALVANGSDAPVEELDPLAGIAAGVLRTIDERPAWRPQEALTIEQAPHAQIVAPTWLSGDERRRGRLLPGLLADLVVLDRDPVTCEPEELREVEVVATMVGGRWVHNPPPWD